jgi:addiction module RelB/DinJ family antitoxin
MFQSPTESIAPSIDQFKKNPRWNPASIPIRFRLEADLKARAEAVCIKQGLELNDVLRALVRRIAFEDAIPFDLNPTYRVAESPPQPFDRDADDLDEDVSQLRAEAVLSLLVSFVADRARRMAAEKKKSRPNRDTLARWEQQSQSALAYRRTLDTQDEASLAAIEREFTALLASDP